MAPEDTGAFLSLTPGQNKNFRLRWCFGCGPESDISSIIFFVSHNGGSPIGIGDSSSYVQGAVSAGLTNGGYTTNQLTVPPGDTYLAVEGCVSMTAPQSTGLTFAPGYAIESEVSLQAIASDLAANDTLDFTWQGFSFGTQQWIQYAGNVRLTVTFGSPFSLLTNSRIPNIASRYTPNL